MSRTAQAGATDFEVFATGFPPGLFGTLTWELRDGQGNVVMSPRAAGIIEDPPASGNYGYTIPLVPGQDGTYLMAWDPHTGDPTDIVTEELVITPGPSAPGAPPDAAARLASMTEATSFPTLTTDELDALLAVYATPDGSYDFAGAAAEAWMKKAGKVAGSTDIADEAAQVRRSQAHAQCLAMAKWWRGEADRLKTQADASTAQLASFVEQPYEPLPRESSRYPFTAP